MGTAELHQKSSLYLTKLCEEIPERCVGSEGNRKATRFFANEMSSLGWDTDMPEFETIDWEDGGATLQADDLKFEAFVSPYSLGCVAEELLLLAKLLENYRDDRQIEIVALNGEDHYAAPGQMQYVRQNQGHFGEILLNINIDGAGYRDSQSVFSYFGLPDAIRRKVDEVVRQFDGITEGVPWPQGDHSIFVQNGCAAIVVSSKWFTENIANQQITHTPKDNIDIVDCKKVVEIAEALCSLTVLLRGS